MSTHSHHIILCGDVKKPRLRGPRQDLSFNAKDPAQKNMKVELPKFVKAVYHLPERVLDLLEIASYVFAADRKVSRGSTSAVEFHSWSREMKFYIKVRDFNFWNADATRKALAEALTFMTGDAKHEFEFQPGRHTDPIDLFDNEEFHIESKRKTEVVLFSGGLDSLTGALTVLHETDSDICLVSHRSGLPGTTKTQNQLVNALQRQFPGRVKPYSFHCGLASERSLDESQRTRAFLFTSIAFALAHAYSEKYIVVFENGITSMNLPRREDMINARSSRTTHPKTLWLLEQLFCLIGESGFKIKAPFFLDTKTDVLARLSKLGETGHLTSSVSCSKAFRRSADTTHCGYCYQCIDRRFAIYATNIEDCDNEALYSEDFITDTIKEPEAKTGLIDYIRQAIDFSRSNSDSFAMKYIRELVDIVDFIEGKSQDEKIVSIYILCKRHGQSILDALKVMRSRHDDPSTQPKRDSLLRLVDEREYLKSDVERFIADLIALLSRSLPIMFRKNRPANENDLNDKIDGLLNGEKDRFVREHPSVPFALTKAIADHASLTEPVLIESKLLKKGVTLRGVTEDMGADMIKYPADKSILFVIYDPDGMIYNPQKFSNDLKTRDSRVYITIIK